MALHFRPLDFGYHFVTSFIGQMTPAQITTLRDTLKLSQVEFAQLFGVHHMTVSKWERGIMPPSSYQQALMKQFAKVPIVRHPPFDLKNILVSDGVIAALRYLIA